MVQTAVAGAVNVVCGSYGLCAIRERSCWVWLWCWAWWRGVPGRVVVGQGVVRASLWAAVLAALAGVVAAVAAIWPLLARPSRVLVPPELEVPGWVVDRPAEAGRW